MNTDRIHEAFPAPAYRGNQRAALDDVAAAFDAGNDVVLVRAPTGSGKSLLARAIAGCARRAEDAAPADAIDAYYTTPQVSQLDDVAADDLLSDLAVVRGKNNYTCILPGEMDTPVDRAPCARERGYDCAVQHRCPYFSDRNIAANKRVAAMTLAYFMQTAGSDVFRKRDVVVVDEAHGLAEWAEMYATIRLGPRTVPDWGDLAVPVVDDVERAVDYADRLGNRLERRKDELLREAELTADQVSERDRLQDLIGDLGWFVEDYRDPGSATTWLVDQDDGPGGGGDGDDDGGGPLTIKPMNPERYLKHTVWDRGNRFALLSATILDKDAFCRQVGLDPANVALVDVGHTFPVEHRPLYDLTQGKMTYEHRDDTVPKVARALVRVMAAHPDEKGLVHCHSYAIQERLLEHLRDMGVAARVRAHDRDGRDAALESWKASDGADVFLSVKMEEALDLEGDSCRWQVLCKAPYPNTGDSRVAHRLSEGQWAWYYRTTLRTVIQACGRVVRSPDDHGATYLVDSSLLDLFERAESDTPGWFRDQIDRMTAPDLPDFDPAAALGDAAGRSGGRRSRSRSGGGSGGSTSSGGAGESGGSTSSGDDDYSTGRSRSGREKKSPLADVWDTDD